MHGQTNDFSKVAATELRNSMTDAEKMLWHRLRNGQLGVKFRRQHPFENYILDFVCIERRLIIEVDGSQHANEQDYDAIGLKSCAMQASRFFVSGTMKF